MARSKLENALYESYVKGEMPRPVKPEPAKMRLTSSAQVRGNYDDGGASQLVKALAGFSDDLGKLFTGFKTRKDFEDQKAAEREYMNLTMEQRKQKIESGELSKFDTMYSAVFSRLYAEDMARASKEQITADIASGKLRFDSQEQLEQHLRSRRDQDLKGLNLSDFALDGYDAQFNAMRQEAGRLNARMRGQERYQRDMAVMQNKFLAEIKPGVTPDALKKLYDHMQLDGTFTDLEMHKPLSEAAQMLARQGRVDELKTMLGTKFAKDKDMGTLGDFLGDQSEILLKSAEAERLNKDQEAFEDTHGRMRQAAHNGQLLKFIGKKTLTLDSVDEYLDGIGVSRRVLTPTQKDNLIQMNANAIERQRAEADRRLAKAQRKMMMAGVIAEAARQWDMFGPSGVQDQLIMGDNGPQTITAASLLPKVQLMKEMELKREVDAGKLTPEDAQKKLLAAYARGGVNRNWSHTLKGVAAAGNILANPQDQGARQAFERAMSLATDMRRSMTPWLLENHVDGKERDLIYLGLTAKQYGQDPVQVVTRALANGVRSVPSKDVLKAIKDERLIPQATRLADMYANGLGMSSDEAIKKAKEDLTQFNLRVNGVSVPQLMPDMAPERQEQVVTRLLKKASANSLTKTKETDMYIEPFNEQSDVYMVRHKSGFAPVLGKDNQPIFVSKKEFLAESAALGNDELAAASNRAVQSDRGPGFKRGKPIDLSSQYTLGQQVDHVVQSMKPTTGLGRVLSESPDYKDMQNWRPKTRGNQ